MNNGFKNAKGEKLFDAPVKTLKALLEAAAVEQVELFELTLSEADLTVVNGKIYRGGDFHNGNYRGLKAPSAQLSHANFAKSKLIEADLSGSNLCHANFSSATLKQANLVEAKLRHANLSKAKLVGCDLRHADLRSSNLTDANLSGADLQHAKFDSHTVVRGIVLDNANLTGEKWEVYLDEVVPDLLTAGGRSLCAAAAGWNCHTWENCPIRLAFGISDPKFAPVHLRQRVNQFVQLYDLGLIPNPLA